MAAKRGSSTRKSEPVIPKFTKSQIIKSNKFAHRRDALNALLVEEKEYTFDEVDEILGKFEGGKK